jgi:uncharacterized RDD family membrane protein YckC
LDLKNEIERATAPAYAGFWKRTAATLVDLVIIMVVTLPMLVALYGTSYFSRSPEDGFAGTGDFLIQIVLPAAFTLVFWKLRGATPGKMVLGLRVADAASLEAPANGQLLIRYIAYLASALPLGLGFLWVAVDKRKQAFHDKLARTVVIEDDDVEGDD